MACYLHHPGGFYPLVEAGAHVLRVAQMTLLPCPFCGSQTHGARSWDVDAIDVTCERCGASGPAGETLKQAEELWNQRTFSASETVKNYVPKRDT